MTETDDHDMLTRRIALVDQVVRQAIAEVANPKTARHVLSCSLCQLNVQERASELFRELAEPAMRAVVYRSTEEA